MNNFFARLAVIVCSCTSAVAHASPTPIYQLGETSGTFISVPLTHEFYRYSHDPQLQDVVVLDAEHNQLPYRVQPVVTPVATPEQAVTATALAFFPVAVDATPDALRKLHTTQVNVQGNAVQVITSDKKLTVTTPEFYLVDVSVLDHDITGLAIDWDEQANNQYLQVALEGTANLQDWVPLGQGTLVQITQQEHSVKRNRISAVVPKKTYDFLRLRIVRGADNLHLTGVTAEQKTTTQIVGAEPNDTWALNGTLAQTQTGVYFPNAHSKTYPVAAWEFTRNETTPVGTVAIDLGTDTYGNTARILSRAASDKAWQLHYQGIWFNAQVGAQWQTSDAVNLHGNRDTYWRIELDESARGSLTPRLQLGWHPAALQIIANNKPPFVVAISSDNNSSATRDKVFNQLIATAHPVWMNAILLPLNVSPESLASTQHTVNWKQVMFWSALGLAVLVLLLFSARLFRQFSAGGGDDVEKAG